MSAPRDVAAALAAVRARIAAAAARVGRAPEAVTLVGVAKRKPADAVAAAVRAGLGHVGENYVQEAAAKLPEVQALLAASGHASPRWHFIGQLQRNKAAAVARAFDAVHTVDREALGAALDRHATAREQPLEVLLQVNLSGEATKGGVPPEAARTLLAAGAAWTHLRVTGLMAIPAPGPDAEASRAAFAQLRRLRDELRGCAGGEHLQELSMGMSGDFEVAIEEGATIVRVGTAIFGAR